MNDDENQARRQKLGRILGGIGSLWVALFVVANFFNVGGTPLGEVLAFFGGSFFIPVALIFAGRAVTRGARRRPEPEQPVQLRPTDRRQTAPKRATRVAQPVDIPEVEASDLEKLEAAIAPLPGDSKPGTANKDQFKARREPTYKPKSSEEMIAEARERLKRKS